MKNILYPNQNQEYSVVTERKKYLFISIFAISLFGFAFLLNTPSEIWKGSIKILFSPANLVTDYFALANPGAALVNASLMALKSLFIVRRNRVALSGPLLAAIFTVVGFSLFGKNLYNSIPIILGVLLYAKLTHTPFKNYLLSALFGTALAPLVSEISFNIGLSLPLGILLGCLSGIIVGFILPPLSRHFASFHKGFSLYNIGFTAGIIGMAFIAVLRAYKFEIDVVNLLSSGNNDLFSLFMYSLFTFMFAVGLYFNGGNFKGYKEFLDEDGVGGVDFVERHGFGLSLINMALLGLITTTLSLLVGGELNGPVLGGIFTVVGFGAFGKHIKNVLPVLAGIVVISLFTSVELSSTTFLLTALFGTTLAPISGHYGAIAGFTAGGLHMSMAANITYLHAGMNLYNNGFSGGFIAAILVPLLEVLHFHKKERKNKEIIKPLVNVDKVENLDKVDEPSIR
ncbi:DUF1576 domain-containing protein [Desemzia sp. RIT804]|uniref:DUF1576 domain-containing protein n=1 Tax=Desemzia sp. RIT 804 TaxID=2810209 RepID=UPI00194F0D48|nr:DUF1576 domain-containing protein [Desemzia sp. RIT 804]MBM6615568.1 DUF1576 domain-containing protein [Desemzia sp. RIT 804]